VFSLLEFIFQGFCEWVYGLILEIWNYFSSALLDVMSLDFAYIKTHIPVMGDIQQIILAVGWALLLGNLVFQALRSMAAGLGFEGEDPKLLFARTFVFGFLLLASPQICEIVLGMTSKVIALLEVPDAINVKLVDGSVFGVFTASWLLVIIFDLITMFMVFSLLLEVAERYMVLAMLTVMAPLAFAMGGSKSTSEIFSGWCRMFGSMCFLMATNIVFFKMLLSVVSTVPSFPDVFLWMVLIVSIVKVAKKADEIITRIGLNPAITGNKSSLPGVIAYTVFRTALSMVTKGAANGIGGALGLTGKAAAGVGKSTGIGKGAAGRAFKGAGKGFGAVAGAVGGIGGTAVGAAVGGIGGAAASLRYGGGRTQTSQTDTRQEQQSNTQQEQNRHTSQQNTSQSQTGGQHQTAGQERTSGGQRTGPGGVTRPGRFSRKTSVQPGTRRGSSYVTLPDSQSKTEEKSTSSSGFTGFHGPQGGGFTGSAPSRGDGFTGGRGGGFFKDIPRGGGFTSEGTPCGGGFSKDTPRGGGFTGEGTPRGGGFSKDAPRGGGFTGEGTPRSGGFGGSSSDTHSGFGGAGAKTDTPRGGGTFGGRPSGTPRGAGFGGTFSKTSQKMEISQSGAAGTGTPPTSGKPGMGTSGSQPGAAGMGTRSTQRPPATEPRHSRNMPPTTAAPTSGVQSSSPVQQEQRRVPGKDRPPMKGGGSASHPGTAGTAKPPSTKLSSGSMPGSQPGTAGTRSTRRPPASEPRHSRNVPPVTAASPSGAQSSSPAQQEQRRASKKDKLPVKSGGSVPRPGMAGTAPGSRTPPVQKLGGGPSKQKPTRQTKREGGPTSV